VLCVKCQTPSGSVLFTFSLRSISFSKDIKAKCSLIPHQEKENPTCKRDSNAAKAFHEPFSMRKALDIPDDMENAAQVEMLKSQKVPSTVTCRDLIQ
jgi:hypothetical protein